jgi:hypothetical protein
MHTCEEASIVLKSVGDASKKMRPTALTKVGYSKSCAYKIIKSAEIDGDVFDKRQSNGSVPKTLDAPLVV